MNDLKFAIRQLLKSPGFTAVAVISLALGIGANTAIFSLVNAILLRSLPVPNPHELRVLKWSGADPDIDSVYGAIEIDAAKHATCDAFSYPAFIGLREELADLADIFGYQPLHSVTVRAKREAFVAGGALVSDNFFSALGVKPLVGRVLSNEDEQAGAVPTAVISHSMWEQQFDAELGVLGQTFTANGHSFTVVGVLPPEFAGVRPGGRTAFYVSLSAQPQLEPYWSRHTPDLWWVQVMARLQPGTDSAQFHSALDVAFAQVTGSVMESPRTLVEEGRRGPDYDRSRYREPLLLLLGVVGAVLLVACANLAGLSLARGASRQHEMAVRAAVGAGRWRLLRQVLIESLTVAVLGGGAGVLLAGWGKSVISRLLAASSEGLRYDTPLDGVVLGFTLATVLVTALVSGLLPALRAARVDPAAGLRTRSERGALRLRTGRLLVAGQVTLSMVLVAGAGLYVRTLINLARIDTGFAMDNLLLFQVDPGAAGYSGERLTAFHDEVQRSLAAIPGVRSVALTQYKLLDGGMSGGSFFTVPGLPETGDHRPQAHRLTVNETFFDTMGIPILLGRGFRAADDEDALNVVVVNDTFARKYLQGNHPIGRSLQTGAWRGVPIDWQVVGVCGDAKYTDIKKEVPATVYFSFRQQSMTDPHFALRTAVPPLAVVPSARRAIAAINPGVPLAGITTQKLVWNKNVSRERLFATLCSALSGLAVLLSCIGLYGLLAYAVARRTGEIGIRMALGATRKKVAGSILREALVLAGIGVVVGLPLALVLSRFIRSQLYGVEPNDPVSLGAAVFALMLVAVVAAWIPARRAARVNPLTALRSE